MSNYRVNLDVFSGPLDLLLYLVRKEEVDIYDIPLASITEEYLRYVDILKSIDIDMAGDFLVLAATLIQVKSAMLLPRVSIEDMDDEITDPRTELVRQLLEYKKYKDAANILGEAAQFRKQMYSRPDTVIRKLKPQAEPELDMDQVNIWDLLEAFDAVMKATGSKIDIARIPDDTPIDLYQIEILHRLQSEGPLTFRRIFEHTNNREVIVGLFLAVLELTRNKLIWLEQAESGGDLYLRSLTDEPAEQAVRNVIMASESTEPQTSATKEAVEHPGTAEAEESTEQTAADTEPTEEEQSRPEKPPIPIAELPAESKFRQADPASEKSQS